jgi:hypothetical protein
LSSGNHVSTSPFLESIMSPVMIAIIVSFSQIYCI